MVSFLRWGTGISSVIWTKAAAHFGDQLGGDFAVVADAGHPAGFIDLDRVAGVD